MLKNYNQWKIHMLYHVIDYGTKITSVFLSFQMVLAFLWSWSRCPHDPAGSDRVLCIYSWQVSCRSVTYSELCKNPSIRRRQGQNKTHCWIYQGVFCWKENPYLSFIWVFIWAWCFFVDFFVHLIFSPTIYRNTRAKLKLFI